MSETSNIIKNLNRKLTSYLTEIKDLRSGNYLLQKEKIDLLTEKEEFKEKELKIKYENDDLKEIVFELTQKNNELEKKISSEILIKNKDIKTNIDLKKNKKTKIRLDYQKIEEDDKNIDFDNEDGNVDNEEEE